MTTHELIEAALVADERKAQTAAALEQVKASAAQAIAAAKADDDDAAEAVADAHLAVHDDLSGSGPALYIDEGTTPATYYFCTAVDPADFVMTPVRVA